MFKNKTQNKSGFTLIEIVITVAIFSLVVLMISSTYFVAQKAYVKADNKAEISQNGRVIIDRIARELRQTPDIITALPTDNSDPDLTPNEIMFQDGHNTDPILYIRYYLDGTNINRQVIGYYFTSNPGVYVRWHSLDPVPPDGPPVMEILEDRLVGEYVSNLEFWGTKKPTYINLNMRKNHENVILNTAVYARNL